MKKNDMNHPWFFWYNRKVCGLNPLRSFIWCIKEQNQRFWISFWYKRDKCPICKKPIEWSWEPTSEYGTGFDYPVHLNEMETDCEGVC